MKKEEKRYTVTMTESQLRLVSNAVEDFHRFLAGQCEMNNATSLIEDVHSARENLDTFVRPYIVPQLRNGASYKWSGEGCPNKHQKRAIAMSYMIYREIIHFFTVNSPKKMDWSVYRGETLRCEEQGPMIVIREADKDDK